MTVNCVEFEEEDADVGYSNIFEACRFGGGLLTLKMRSIII